MVIGIDEVGRGSWAGPLLVVAARNHTALPQGLKDSKLLTKIQRAKLYELLIESCQFGEGWVQPEEIDAHGLAEAMRYGVSRALVNLGADFEAEIVLDGNVNYCPAEFINAKTVINADALYPLVSAASIYAKVKRDGYMGQIAQFYPEYEFEKHVGYGTELHRQALLQYGTSQIHRQSFKPVSEFAARTIKKDQTHTVTPSANKPRTYLHVDQ